MTSDTSLEALVIGDERDDKDSKGKGEKAFCFKLVYPISITMPDATVLSGNEETLWGAVKTWYETNSDSEEKPSLNYPIDILWKGEIAKTINDDTELKIAKRYCDEEKEDCFKLVYPITWTMPDDTAISMNDETDWGEIKAWYEANSNSEEKMDLNYPVDVILKDGTTQAVADDSEMEVLKKNCE